MGPHGTDVLDMPDDAACSPSDIGVPVKFRHLVPAVATAVALAVTPATAHADTNVQAFSTVCRATHTAYRKAARSRYKENGPGPGMTHGLFSTYTVGGCRCTECAAAAAAMMREQHESRRQRMEAGSPDVPHGTNSGYAGWSCRCESCIAARKAYVAKRVGS